MTMCPPRQSQTATCAELLVHVDDSARIISVVGDLELSSADALVARAAELTAITGDLVLDLGGVQFLCAAGIGAIIRIRNAQRAHDSRLLLQNVPDPVRRTLKHGGADALLADAA
jgi:anti-anti-sigma factor